MRLEREKARYLTINVTNLIRDPGGPRTCVQKDGANAVFVFIRIGQKQKIVISKKTVNLVLTRCMNSKTSLDQ